MVWIPVESRGFTLLQNVQKGAKAHPASCSAWIAILSLGKAAEAWN